MISAFGVEHGEVSKAYAKLFPKLSGMRMYKDTKIQPHVTLDSKLRQHSVAARLVAGGGGGRVRYLKKKGEDTTRAMARAVEHKKGAHGMYAAISRNNRKNRGPLP